MRRRPGGFGIIFLMIALIIFASGAIVVYVVFMKPEKISTVPALTGKSVVEAVSEAERLELVVQVERVASTMPEGRVLAQSPSAGTELRKGKVIVLQVAGGGELHPVPDVSGKTLADAQSEIRSQGFGLGDVVRIREAGVQAGTVIAQSPAAPANIAAGRKIDLLVQDAGDASGNVTIPDVNRMTESEARNVLTASGLSVSSVNRVYSPLLPEGLAIETQPAAGTAIKSGQGVILKLATQRRPAGYMDGESGRRVTSNQEAQQTEQAPAKPAQTTTPAKAQTPAEAIRQSTQAAQTTQTTTPAPAKPAQTPAPAQTTTPAPSGGSKTARIRYIVPPISRPMNLRVEITDPNGKRDVLNRQVRSGEAINTTARYTSECLITYYLGGEFVWQERQN
ncbi:MAG: PASTA domain-containing protein [Synergistaceae bacterium]|nr:PASTA domain-containing protein [Synergistaceae bacterium]